MIAPPCRSRSGARRDEGRAQVREFLAEARQHDWQRVRIITGKGLHSTEGYSVLRDAIKQLLNTEGYTWKEAKVNDGGEGALEVKLR